ncbi:hypothetical protein DAI22_11g031300 [Oryza sativa Japonica Group]|nr:hypothetical protein DAI22_11g031300 [Oryza sativa Japonica Group]
MQRAWRCRSHATQVPTARLDDEMLLFLSRFTAMKMKSPFIRFRIYQLYLAISRLLLQS